MQGNAADGEVARIAVTVSAIQAGNVHAAICAGGFFAQAELHERSVAGRDARRCTGVRPMLYGGALPLYALGIALAGRATVMRKELGSGSLFGRGFWQNEDVAASS